MTLYHILRLCTSEGQIIGPLGLANMEPKLASAAMAYFRESGCYSSRKNLLIRKKLLSYNKLFSGRFQTSYFQNGSRKSHSFTKALDPNKFYSLPAATDVGVN
jgi:hypothetical protein